MKKYFLLLSLVLGCLFILGCSSTNTNHIHTIHIDNSYEDNPNTNFDDNEYIWEGFDGWN